MPSREPALALPLRLEQHLRETGLLTAGATVVVALSGGLDSTVLLHLLRFPLARLGLRLAAAHLDHAMRPGSAADASWVVGLCAAWQVPLMAERLTAPPVSEADARDRRYEFLDRAAAPGALIATGHHLDDQAETVLFRVARGAGVRGVRGIAPRRGRLVRPLLPFTRAELAAYAGSVGLAFRDDPTNRDVSLARNRIRRWTLPALERARPGAARTLAALADRARHAERAWRTIFRDLSHRATVERSPGGVALARDVLRSYHPLVRARVLRLVLRRLGSMPGRAGTRAALEFINSGPSGGELHLPGGIRLHRDFDAIRVARLRGPAPADVEAEIAAGTAGSGRVRIAGRTVDVDWGPGPLEGEKVGVPADAAFPLRLRGWAPGDRIRLAYGSKKLKKLFAERRLDRRQRATLPVLADAEGRVLWVPGVARAAGVPDGGGFEIAVRDAEER
ncbi:MAG TPA: tRNA lysidine(34) synthetase TilS [Longimicrobiales bacterium]|nr:tRNA lysidine(34) synthetase TilS [Longimicrobiales bacterium]